MYFSNILQISIIRKKLNKKFVNYGNRIFMIKSI